jgi:hypothetical protein
MSESIIDIADLDCIFLTYDEPKKEEFWIKIRNMVPWATRVDGVKGSDAAHKAAAQASGTDRFILIDGDNIPDPAFFNQQLLINESNKNCVFRWRARNAVNGLMYGNGGLSCWTRDFVLNMQTHESSNGQDENNVEFCFHPDYWAMNDCYSTTYPNATPFQAWRAGFREGVKMCLDRGTRPSLEEFESRIHNRNYDNLCIWQSVGADVDNGFWSIYGARLGTYKTMLTSWDYNNVQWFDSLAEIWENEVIKDGGGEIDQTKDLGDALRIKLGLNIVDLDPAQSKFFKHHYMSQFKNKGIMIRE